jgi:hypothetical protein
MTRPDGADFRKGRHRLRQLLPWARAEARKGHRTELQSMLAMGQAKYMVETNFDALIIYPAPLGGWHADLTLNVPPGVPNSIGSPVAEPLLTRADAMEKAKQLLVVGLQIAADQALMSDGKPVFLLYDYAFKLSLEVTEQALKRFPDGCPYGSPEWAAARIEQVLQVLCGDREFTGDDFEKWDKELQLKLMAVLHGAALSGLYAYPQRRDASPSGLSEGEISKVLH